MIVSELSIKKQYERFLLEQFLEVAGLSGEIVDETGEAPDFIVQIERELVGVEITELFIIEGGRAGNLQAQETLAQRIVSRAQRLYVLSGARHAYVSVHFALGVDLRMLNRNHTAAALADFV